MTELKDKIQTGLDESRMLVLGAQILIGFAFSATFQTTFPLLSRLCQNLNLLALTLMLATICLLISSTVFHQLTEDGNDSVRLQVYTRHIMESALVLFSVALGADVYVSAEATVGSISATVLALAMTATALTFWSGPFLLVRGQNSRARRTVNTATEQPAPRTSLHDKIRHVLTEARVILPGRNISAGIVRQILPSK